MKVENGVEAQVRGGADIKIKNMDEQGGANEDDVIQVWRGKQSGEEHRTQ